MGNYAFIDSQNLNLSIKAQGWNLDFRKFRIYLKDKLNIMKAFLFIGYNPTNTNMYTNLQSYGYIIVFKPTLSLPDGKIKGNIDAELVLHTMLEYNNFDKAVIVSGDGDFFCLIEHLEKHKKLCKLIIPDKEKYSSLLKKFMPEIIFMNGLKKKLEYIK